MPAWQFSVFLWAAAIVFLHLSFTTFSTLGDHHALGWRLTQLKEMENLGAFSVREVKRAAAEESERERVFLCKKNSKSQSKRQSYPNKLSENYGKGAVRWGGRAEKEEQLVELEVD